MGDRDEISVVELYAEQRVTNNRLNNIESTTMLNHKENRSSIHSIKNDLQDLCDEVWKLKIKIAGYSAVAGVITSLAIKLVEHFVK